MSYQILPGGPTWSFDPIELERQAAAVANTNGLTGQAAWAAFINGLTTGNTAAMLAICKTLAFAVKCNLP